MDFTRFPRRRYCKSPTPLEPLPRLSRHLGGKVDIWIKRDDLLPDASGGNKTRKLEFSIGAAIAQGADTLITCGALQSNHCRLTLAYARKEGLDCHLILVEPEPGAYNPKASGNNFLYHLLGASGIRIVTPESDLPDEMQKTAELLRKAGKSPYIIPMGASNATGALGYALFVEELMTQVNDMALKIDQFIIPSGSTGTHAGIVTGLSGNNVSIPVTGINVLARSRELQEKLVHSLSQELAHILSIPDVPGKLVNCVDDYVGPGYALPTEAMKEAVFLFAREEGILLDPVYSGKTAAGLVDFVRQGRFSAGSTVLFLHTGGTPALYAYQDIFDLPANPGI